MFTTENRSGSRRINWRQIDREPQLFESARGPGRTREVAANKYSRYGQLFEPTAHTRTTPAAPPSRRFGTFAADQNLHLGRLRFPSDEHIVEGKRP